MIPSSHLEEGLPCIERETRTDNCPPLQTSRQLPLPSRPKVRSRRPCYWLVLSRHHWCCYSQAQGFLLLSFTPKKFMEIYIVRQRILIVLSILLISNLIVGYVWIPSSHFIYVMWAAIILCFVSLFYHYKS